MKAVALLICFVLCGCHAASSDFSFEDVVKAAKQLTVSQFEALKAGLNIKSVERRQEVNEDEEVIDPNGHFCCTHKHIRDQNWNTTSHTITKWEYKQVTHMVKHGYTKCGGLGWGRCSLYKKGYAQELFSYTQLIEFDDVKACPQEHIKCCSGYTMFKDGNCIRLNDLRNEDLQDAMCRLARIGLLDVHKRPTNCPSDAKE